MGLTEDEFVALTGRASFLFSQLQGVFDTDPLDTAAVMLGAVHLHLSQEVGAQAATAAMMAVVKAAGEANGGRGPAVDADTAARLASVFSRRSPWNKGAAAE